MATPASDTMAKIVRPELSNTFACMGSIRSWLFNNDETEGGLTMLRFVSQPGSEPPAHIHLYEHKYMAVVEGEIEFFVEGEQDSFLVTKENTNHLPRGKAHGLAFRTPRVSATAILQVVDGDQTCEKFLKSMSSGPALSMELPSVMSLYQQIDPKRMQEVTALAAEYGVTFLDSSETAKRLPNFPQKN